MKLIKKYKNRKLYDTNKSAYVTLQDVEDMVLAGVSLVVRDYSTKNDITANTLVQLLCEKEMRMRNPLTVDSLLRVVAMGSFSEFVAGVLVNAGK